MVRLSGNIYKRKTMQVDQTGTGNIEKLTYLNWHRIGSISKV
jgi:hypothetical protein